MMSKFDEFLILAIYYFLKGWKIILPVVVGLIFFAGYSTAEAGYMWTD